MCPLPTQVFSSTSTTLPIRVELSLRAYRHLLNALSKKWPAVFFSTEFELALQGLLDVVPGGLSMGIEVTLGLKPSFERHKRQKSEFLSTRATITLYPV